jgi:hypothetical protein
MNCLENLENELALISPTNPALKVQDIKIPASLPPIKLPAILSPYSERSPDFPEGKSSKRSPDFPSGKSSERSPELSNTKPPPISDVKKSTQLYRGHVLSGERVELSFPSARKVPIIINRNRHKRKDLYAFSKKVATILGEELAFHFSLPCDAFCTYTCQGLINLCVRNKVYVDLIYQTHCHKKYNFCISLRDKLPSIFHELLWPQQRSFCPISGKKGVKQCALKIRIAIGRNHQPSYRQLKLNSFGFHSTRKSKVSFNLYSRDISKIDPPIKLEDSEKEIMVDSLDEALSKLFI